MPIACSALFEFLLIFSYSKTVKFSWSLEEFHPQIALNLQKYALFFAQTAHMPCLFKIYPGFSFYSILN